MKSNTIKFNATEILTRAEMREINGGTLQVCRVTCDTATPFISQDVIVRDCTAGSTAGACDGIGGYEYCTCS